MRQPDARIRAFTLIELLVVVAIIALLIGILVPSLAQARAQARSAACKSNIHQVGLGMLMYHHQYRAYPAHRSPMPQDHRWFIAMTKILGSKEVQNCPTVPDWEVGRNISYGYNYKYLGSARENPESPTKPYEKWPVKSVRVPFHTIAFGDNDGTGWKKAHLNYDPDNPDSKDPDRFGNHGYTLDPTYIPEYSVHSLNNNRDPEHYSWTDQKTDLHYRTYPSTRHGGGGNFCFVDGHVERLLPKQILQDNRYWNGLGTEDPRRDPHVPYKHAAGTEWRFEGTIPATGE